MEIGDEASGLGLRRGLQPRRQDYPHRRARRRGATLGRRQRATHPRPPLIHSGRQVFSVAFSPDGKTILTGGQDCMARLWDVATMRPIGPPIVHDDYIGEPDDWVRAV